MIKDKFKKMTVGEIKEMLIETGSPKDEVEALKGKRAVVDYSLDNDAILEHLSGDVDFSEDTQDFEVVEEVVPVYSDDGSNEEEETPTPNDPGWTRYVLKQLNDDELFDGNPTVDGLRRLVNKFIGPIIGFDSHIVQAPSPENDHYASVKVTLDVWNDERHILMKFSGVGGVGPRNTDDPFARYAESTAETRAEAKALRRVLRLKSSIYCADEVSKVSNVPTSLLNSSPLNEEIFNPTQANAFRALGERANVNIEKLFKKLFDVPLSKDSISKERAAKVIATLSSLQGGLPDDDVVGYVDTWESQLKG